MEEIGTYLWKGVCSPTRFRFHSKWKPESKGYLMHSSKHSIRESQTICGRYIDELPKSERCPTLNEVRF